MAQIITSNSGGGGGASYTAGTGIEISAQNEISVDTDVVQTVGNMVDNLTGADDDHYPTAKAVADAISGGGLGDVVGPASSTDEDVVVFDGATGKLIKDSGVKLSSKLDASALSDNNYGGAWQGDSTHTPTKGVLYDKIHTMDVEIGNKAADNTVVKLSGNQTIAGTKTFSTSPVVPSKTSDATNTGTAIATEAQVYKKQDTLVNQSNIKSVNGNNLLGSGNIVLFSVIQVTLAAASWSSEEITVTATGVTASNHVIVSPDPSSITDYADALVYCSNQASNSLTFKCTTAPENDITVNVLIIN